MIVHTTTRLWEHGEVRSNEGIRLTSPERSILDAAEAGTQPEQIELAIAQATRRGWLDVPRLRATARTRERRVMEPRRARARGTRARPVSLMRYPTAAAFRRALEDRLNQRARATGEPVMRLRKNVTQ